MELQTSATPSESAAVSKQPIATASSTSYGPVGDDVGQAPACKDVQLLAGEVLSERQARVRAHFKWANSGLLEALCCAPVLCTGVTTLRMHSTPLPPLRHPPLL